MQFRRLLTAAAVVLGLSATTYAGLMGANVNVSAYYPDTSSLYQAGVDTTVSAAVEYPSGSFSLYNGSWQVDISDTQITITDLLGTGFPYAPASFNGWVLTILSGPALASASVDPSSSFSPVDISIVGDDQLWLNYGGVNAQPGSVSTINIVTGEVPEPATAFTVLVAGAVLMAARRLRKKLPA